MTLVQRKRITAAEPTGAPAEYPVELCGGHHDHKRAFREAGERRGPRSRPLTFAEKKINWDSIEKYLDQAEENLSDEAKALLNGNREDFLKQLQIAALSGDTDKVRALELKGRAEYKALVKSTLKDAYETGKNTAAREMGVPPPPTPLEDTRYIDIAADNITDQHLSRIELDTKGQLADALLRNETVAATIAAIEARMVDLISDIADNTAGIVVSGYFNKGRRTTFEKNGDDIYALQRSEVLDSRTCNYCLSIDGRIIDLTDPFGKVDQFHTSCRGIWVEILKIEESKPEIDGIPPSIRNRFGGTVNDLIQPRVPLTKNNTMARQYVLRKRTK